MIESKQPDFINMSREPREAGQAIVELVGDSSLVGNKTGTFEKTDDEEFPVAGILSTGQSIAVSREPKLIVDGNADTEEIYGVAHWVKHQTNSPVKFDEDCGICNP